MSDRSEKAAAEFAKCNCSQAVLSSFGPELGLGKAECLRVAACFGAGMGRLGRTCGALTGGLMVLGLRHAKEMLEDPRGGRDSVYGRVQALTKQFEAEHGSSECATLIGCDMLTAAGRASFTQRGLHQTLCTQLVKSVVEMLEQ
jgi:C_GCAxxG_C_C family probable redox protein